MKYFKSLAHFEKRIQDKPDWDDYFMLNGKMFVIYEYGGGSMFHMDYDYVYFINRRTHDVIYVKYYCPASRYVDGKKVVTKKYQLISVEYTPNIELWRAIV